MSAVVPTNGKTALRGGRGLGGTHRASQAFHIARPAEAASGKHRQDGEGAAMIVGYHHVLARRVHAHVARPRALRADCVDENQTSALAVDRIGAHRTGRFAFKRRGFVGRIKVGPGRIRRQTGGI